MPAAATMPAAVTMPLDPAIAEMERRWKEAGIPDLYVGGSGPVSRERARIVRALLYPKPKLEAGRIEPGIIEGPNGAIQTRTIWPREGKPIGTLVFFHGGGWIIGDLDSHEAHAIRLANNTGVVVINVEYRLAPEHPFPQGIEDAMAAMRWTHANKAKLGGATAPLAVAGDSSGGNFAAVCALHARDVGLPLAAQLLIYPATNLSQSRNPDINHAYFGRNAATLAKDYRASPALASLKGIAPAILGVGVHDFLYRDNLAYAAALREAGVPLVLREYPNLNHGFFGYTAISKSSEAAANELCADLRRLMTA
jgi:acetyl esterase